MIFPFIKILSVFVCLSQIILELPLAIHAVNPEYSEQYSHSGDDLINTHFMYSDDNIDDDMIYTDFGRNYRTYTDKTGNKDVPIIIWWTENLFPHHNRKLTTVECGSVTCYSSSDRNRLSHKRTRGIIFYGSDFNPADLPLPRAPHHEWALFHEESPLNNYIFSHNAFLELINHTATFRRESDFPLVTQNIYHPEFLTVRAPVPLSVKNERKVSQNLAPVLYVQSHCAVPSDRDRYIQELMKFIEIDSYGDCLHNKDLPEHLREPAPNFENNEFLELIASYKFHLSFENAICKDYMTEKLMRPLHVGSVPIYRGSPNAKDWMPNDKSVILVDDFQSPQELAEYIKFLDTHDEEYEKYLEYKKPGGVRNQMLKEHLAKRKWHVNIPNTMEFFRGFECHVCHKLSERYEREKQHEIDASIDLLPPKTANSSHLGCPQPYTSLGDPEDIKDANDIWKRMEWVELYWDGFDQARAVKEMVFKGESKPSKYFKYLKKIRDNNK